MAGRRQRGAWIGTTGCGDAPARCGLSTECAVRRVQGWAAREEARCRWRRFGKRCVGAQRSWLGSADPTVFASAHDGQADALRRLLDAGSDPDWSFDYPEHGPGHRCTEHACRGASRPSSCCWTTARELTCRQATFDPLHVAAGVGDAGIVELLLAYPSRTRMRTTRRGSRRSTWRARTGMVPWQPCWHRRAQTLRPLTPRVTVPCIMLAGTATVHRSAAGQSRNSESARRE